MYLYACKNELCGWIEARSYPWGPDRCPECGAWRVSMQQQVEEKHDFIKDSPFEFDSELD